MINSGELLKEEYLRYLKSDEAAAVYFVKNLVSSIETKGKWIHVISCDRYLDHDQDNKPKFRNLTIELFERKVKPKYPQNADTSLKRAITWKTSHEDIDNQRSCGIRGPVFLVIGRYYNKNYGKTVTKTFDHWNEEFGGFDLTGNAPTTTITRTVKMEPEWIYRITDIKRWSLRISAY